MIDSRKLARGYINVHPFHIHSSEGKMKMRVTFVVVALVAGIALGFSPLAPVQQRVRRCNSCRYGVVKDAQDLIRATDGYIRAYLPIFPDEPEVLVPIDEDAVKDSMQSSDNVHVFRKRNIFRRTLFIGFDPMTAPKGIGFVLYPGALVKAEAYAPICRSLADMGYHAALCTPPYLTSLVDIYMADEVIDYWGDDVPFVVVSGHSMGGVAAAAFANQCSEETKEKLKGVVLLASYPSALPGYTDGNLSDDPYDITSIYGSEDGLTTGPFIEISKEFLGPDTKFECIEGGNHSQFYFGTELQLGDKPALISRDKQQEIILKLILQLLVKIEEEAKIEAEVK